MWTLFRGGNLTLHSYATHPAPNSVKNHHPDDDYNGNTTRRQLGYVGRYTTDDWLTTTPGSGRQAAWNIDNDSRNPRTSNAVKESSWVESRVTTARCCRRACWTTLGVRFPRDWKGRNLFLSIYFPFNAWALLVFHFPFAVPRYRALGKDEATILRSVLTSPPVWVLRESIPLWKAKRVLAAEHFHRSYLPGFNACCYSCLCHPPSYIHTSRPDLGSLLNVELVPTRYPNLMT